MFFDVYNIVINSNLQTSKMILKNKSKSVENRVSFCLLQMNYLCTYGKR